MFHWLGSTPTALAWVVAGTALMYISSLIAIRIAGRRTVAQMSAFDFVVTVAIGSIVATTAITEQTPIARGFAAIVTLLLLQGIVGSLRQRNRRFRKLVDFPPEILYDGENLNLPRGPLGAQPTREEVLSGLRQRGYRSIDEADLIVLEPDGKISVLRKGDEASDGGRESVAP